MAKALIFAGGSGQRMNTRSKPKQFLEMQGKPVIIYTLEHFEYHNQIDEIFIVCIEEWIEELKGMLKRYNISKVTSIVGGGETGHDSIFLGLDAMKDLVNDNDIVLIHDGVRPLINENLITTNIEKTKECGNSITIERQKESVVVCVDENHILDVPDRNHMFSAKAPQTFYYGDIHELYCKAKKSNIKTIDSAHLCSLYNVKMNCVISTKNNIKITEPADYFIFKAIYEAMEGQQIFGL